jgi:eukaryotic-like serine/threonine-protein kinase
MMSESHPVEPRVLGRYLFYAPIASGGMATVYLGRMAGPKGFSRIVAIKQLHAQLIHDSEFVTMFLDEAHLIGRIHHSNVVAPIDVVEADGDLCIVMEYVHGEALGRLMRLSRRQHVPIPLRVVTAIMVQTLLGLHAAHEVTDGDGQPLSMVHRDVSPQNILVGQDGIARVVDFGIAKAAHRAYSADAGKLKGKLRYMAPEQLMLGELDRRCDIFSAGIILWELLTGKKLFVADNPAAATERMRGFEPQPPSSIVPTIASELDAITTKSLCVDPTGRFATAHEMARALEEACPPAGAIEVAEWVTQLVGDTLKTRAEWITDLVSIDMGEWTQSYVLSNAPPTAPSASPRTEPEAERSLPPSTETVRPTAVALRLVERVGSMIATSCHRIREIAPISPRNRVAAAFVLLLAVGAAGHQWWPRRAAPTNHREPTVMVASPPASFAVATEPSADGEPSQTTTEAPTSSAVESTAFAKPSVSVAAPHAAARTSGSSGHPDCRVPYVIDAKHIKRFRPECFKRH